MTGSISDGNHTFDELYQFRAAYNAGMANLLEKVIPGSAVKSKRHHDGELCFGGGFFIVVMSLPNGQVSNHYKLGVNLWNMFMVPEVDLPPVWDGHSSDDALYRLENFALNFDLWSM